MMPIFLGTVIAVLPGIASAAGSSDDSRVVLDVVVSEGYSNSTAEFATNDEAKRAWVEAAVDDGGLGDDHRRDTFRVRVPDLSYDVRTGEIVDNHQGSPVVCASVKISRFLFTTQTQIRGTANCKLLARLERRTDDNGFEYENHKHLVVELKVTRP